jgi:hypothetical protein
MAQVPKGLGSASFQFFALAVGDIDCLWASWPRDFRSWGTVAVVSELVEGNAVVVDNVQLVPQYRSSPPDLKRSADFCAWKGRVQ